MTTSAGNGKGDRGIQDAVSYAVGHRIRVEILTALHERSASAIELSRIVHQPLSTVTHHIKELLDSGSIGVERTEKVRSVEQRFYVINPIYFTDEEMAGMSQEQLQNLVRYLLQGLMAEAMASFWAGHLTSADPRLFISWAWFNVDEEGRTAIADEQARSWRRLYEIEEEAASRCAAAGEVPFSVTVSALSLKRVRTAPRPVGSRDGT
jgi:DNA-binding transcriptional ArsR family regulator